MQSEKQKKKALVGFLFGAGGRTRTGDLLITNQLLYQLSHTSTLIIIAKEKAIVKRKPKIKAKNIVKGRFFGGAPLTMGAKCGIIL